MRLFERADPARIEDAAAVADRPVDLATLRTRSSNVTLIDTEPTPTRPPNRHRLLIIISAAAAVVLIVAGAIVLATRDADEPQHPVAPPTTVTPAQPAAEEIARGFIDAERVTFDADRAITYLSGEALVDVGGSREEYRLLLSFLQRTGSDTINIECEQRDDTAAGVVVRCSYDQHMFRSDELGLGPYTGNYQDLTVHDGTIVEVSGYSPLEPFSSEIWTPFKQWVSTEYPDDVELMYRRRRLADHRELDPTLGAAHPGVRAGRADGIRDVRRRRWRDLCHPGLPTRRARRARRGRARSGRRVARGRRRDPGTSPWGADRTAQAAGDRHGGVHQFLRPAHPPRPHRGRVGGGGHRRRFHSPR